MASRILRVISRKVASWVFSVLYMALYFVRYQIRERIKGRGEGKKGIEKLTANYKRTHARKPDLETKGQVLRT